MHREGGDPDRQGQHFKSRQSHVIKGRTVIVNDSFAEWAAPLLTPWFEDLVFFDHESVGNPEMEKCLQESDTISPEQSEYHHQPNVTLTDVNRRNGV